MATIGVSRVALAAGSAGAACFPTDAVLLQPNREPAPDGCGQWRRCNSTAQTALGSANAVLPTTELVCQSDSHALAQSAAPTPERSARHRLLDLLSTQTSSRGDRALCWSHEVARRAARSRANQRASLIGMRFHLVTSTGRLLASVPFHMPSGSPCVVASLGCSLAPSLRGLPFLPVGAGAGRYTQRLLLRRPNTPLSSALQRHHNQLAS